LVRKNSYIRNNDLRIMYEHPSPKPNRKIWERIYIFLKTLRENRIYDIEYVLYITFKNLNGKIRWYDLVLLLPH
jgi:hypothetical protein